MSDACSVLSDTETAIVIDALRVTQAAILDCLKHLQRINPGANGIHVFEDRLSDVVTLRQKLEKGNDV